MTAEVSRANEAVAREHGMIGICLNAEIPAPSLACFVRGSHEAGTFVELLLHHQFETENKQAGNQYWVFHGAVYRCVFGHNTAGEMVDPSSGIRTEAPADYEHNQETCIKPHPEPMASTLEYKDQCILEVDGNKETESCDILKPSTGADVLRCPSIISRRSAHCGVSHSVIRMVWGISGSLFKMAEFSYPRRLCTV